jgi:uncharacterized protein DUF6433
MIKLGIYETLQKADKAKTLAEKVEILRKNANKNLATVLRYALHPDVKWMLKAGTPNFKGDTLMTPAEDVLGIEARRLYLFVEGGNPSLTEEKREKLFVNMLDTMSKEEAEFLVAIKDGKFPFTTITKDVVNAAFPGAFSG